ncbi:MAG TPA: sigma-70 family RNA polymerase sigma factor [Gemmataceae bacterium]|nr:sigma-70 family RNA polymerase sigma factor [Gemmataceae bacterium]
MGQDTLNDVLRHLRRLCEAEDTRDLHDSELLKRFLERHEETAFAILVGRHGPMVLGVCQRILHDSHAAEDAFQATFLVLVRRSAAIRKRGSVGSWLHGVAQRIALRARAQSAAQRDRIRRFDPIPRADTLDELSWQELRTVLDEEIGALAEKYRAPVVLCCLEGKSYDQAARELGWPKSSLANRLTQARGVLRKRLVQRGIFLSAATLAAGLTERVTGAALPALLTIHTVKAATLYSAGKITAGVSVSSQAITLAEEVMKGMFGFKAKIAAGFLTALILAGGAVLARHHAVDDGPQPEASKEKQAGDPGFPSKQLLGDTDLKKPAADAKKPPNPSQVSFTYAGRVLNPDGKGLAGAKLYISGLTPGVIEYRQRAVSGADGAFRFTVRRDEFGDKGVVPPSRSPPERFVMIGATADECGAVALGASKAEERENLTLWLPAEEVVHGRFLTLEGKPVAGVKVSASLWSGQADKDHKPLPYDLPFQPGRHDLIRLVPSDEKRNVAVSDKDGSVTLHGLGRGWAYTLYISGPTVVNMQARLDARPQKSSMVGATGISPPNRPPPQLPLYGSTFTHAVLPSKPIQGVVREMNSDKPLAGVGVGTQFTRDDDPQAQTTTDQEGRYKLIGLPPGVHTLRVDPAANSPYLATEVRVNADQPGIEPVNFDIRLERRPAVSGRVTDQATGKPLKAWVEHRPLAKNLNLKTNAALATPRFGGQYQPMTSTDKDGRFMLPVLEGPGMLLIRSETDYPPARLAEADRMDGVADAADPELIDCRPLPAWPGEWHAYRFICVQKKRDIHVEIALAPGIRRPLLLEFPDGKAHGATVLGLRSAAQDSRTSYYPDERPTVILDAGETRRLFLSSHDGQFAVSSLVSTKEAGPIRVKLKPTGTITGRVLDQDGKPIQGASFQMFFDDGPGRPGVFVYMSSIHRLLTSAESKRKERTSGFRDLTMQAMFPYSIPGQTDDQGRFRITGLLPDVPFDLKVQLLGQPNTKGERFVTAQVSIARPTVKPGKTCDLGDLRAIQPPEK